MPGRTPADREVLEVGPLEVVPEDHIARLQGRVLTLSGRELRVLTELARRADRIIAREELFSLVWGRGLRPGDRSLDVYVRRLRVKLEAALPGWRFIHTHFGIGYRLTPEPGGGTYGHSQLDNTGAAPAAHTGTDKP
jgi:DNA-binding response OmpR family regulator